MDVIHNKIANPIIKYGAIMSVDSLEPLRARPKTMERDPMGPSLPGKSR